MINHFRLAFGFIVLSCAITSADPPKKQADTVTIPLDQIWALSMPGTRDIRELEPEVFGKESALAPANERESRYGKSLINGISKELEYLSPRSNKTAGPGFVVTGTAIQALRAARGVLSGEIPRRESWPVGTDLWIVFFAHQSDRYVQLREIDRNGDDIQMRYLVVPHRTKEMTIHFALIPFGSLPVGHYKVEMVQINAEQDVTALNLPEVSQDRVQQIVCRPFSFVVTNAN